VKRHIGLIILTISAVTLAATYFILSKETSPTKTGKVFDISSSDSINEVKLINSYGEFLFEKEEGTWKLLEPGVYNVNQKKLLLIEKALLDLQINRTLDQELPEYGLENPKITVAFSTTKNIHRTLYIGNLTPSESQVYIKNPESNEVFVSDIGTIAQFDGSLAAYRGKEVFFINKEEIIELSYIKDGVRSLSLVYLGPKNWQITYPISAPARYIEIGELMVAMRKWTAAGYPDTANTDYKTYGLDTPQNALVLKDASGKTQTIEFGNTNNGLIYVRTGTKEDILQLYSTDVDFPLFTVEKLLFVLPLQTKIENVTELKIESSDKTSTYKLDHTKSPIEITLSGKNIPYEDFVTLFVKYTGLSADGYDDKTEPGPTFLTLTTTYVDGTKESVNLYERSADSYYIESSEYKNLYIDKEQVDRLITSWEAIFS
jgi:hypothetical protein